MNAKKMKWLAAALIALIGPAGKAGAATTAYLNIDVTFSNAMSVTVNSVNSSTYTVNWTLANEELLPVSGSSATVSNNSVATERWKLYTNPNSLPVSGSSWTAVASSAAVGADEFTVQAVFGSSNTVDCAALTAALTWNLIANAQVLTTSFATGLQYTFAGALASPQLTNNGTQLPDTATNSGSMYGGRKRALCWRVIAPLTTVATNTQNIQVIVAAY